MCTVLFIPKGDKYFFASLRDENPLRPRATAPDFKLMGNTNVLSPTDALAGGTWLGITETGKVIILLNGAFEKHERKANYTKSRGFIVAELLASNSPIADWDLFEMKAVEPFTLVVWCEGDLFELVWDGEIKHSTRLEATQPYIWSSSTLYNGDAKAHRKSLYQNWLGIDIPVSALSLLNFFKSHPDVENGFLMNRNEQTKTLSYSFIELQLNKSAELHYYDFSGNTCTTKNIVFGKSCKAHFLSNELSESKQTSFNV